jgi:hypothetical protein
MLTDVSGGYLTTFRTTQTRARASKRLTSLNSNGPPSTSASGYCNHWHNVRKQSNFTRSAAYVTYRENIQGHGAGGINNLCPCHGNMFLYATVTTLSHHTENNMRQILTFRWPCISIFISVFNQKYVFFWVFPRRLRFKSRRFGTLYWFHLPRQVLHLPRKMEPIAGSETSAFKPQTPGKYPKENI